MSLPTTPTILPFLSQNPVSTPLSVPATTTGTVVPTATNCQSFSIWQICANITNPVNVDPNAVSELTNIIYATFPTSIRPVTVEGYHIVGILGGIETCPASFDPNKLVKVDRLTHELTGNQVQLLRTLIENQIVQSARRWESDARLHAYLASKGLTLDTFLALISEEVSKIVTPSFVELLMSLTQPQTVSLSYNSGVIRDDLCQVKAQLPIVVFSASLLERITRAILNNPILYDVFSGLPSVIVTNSQIPSGSLSPSIGDSRSVSGSTWLWIILLILLLVLVAWLVFQH